MVTPIDPAQRAVRVWIKIQRNPSSVIFTKPRVVAGDGTVTAATPLDAQTVRVVADNRATPVEGVAGAAPTRAVMIYGVRDHPDETVIDTDLAVGYTARIDDKEYRVTQTWLVPGGIQAQARLVG